MHLSEFQIDALKEFLNIGVGRAASTLNELVHAHVTLEVPHLQIFSSSTALSKSHGIDADLFATVTQGFSGQFSGTAALIFPPASANTLVNAITSEKSQRLDLGELKTATLTEVGNMVLNGVMGSIANVLERHLQYDIPTYQECMLEDLVKKESQEGEGTCLLAETHFSIDQLHMEGQIFLIFKTGSFEALLEVLDTLTPHTI